jgi:phosphoglycolate phosphatase-like HAD superfamily hydrolase
MRTLIIFDIDGTLLDSVTTHQAAFRAALGACGLTDVNDDWGGYAHHTDSWIFREAFRSVRGRSPNSEETAAFAAHLHREFAAGVVRERPAEIPGAARFLRALADAEDITAVYATGGMREATLLKLAMLLPDVGRAQLATASEHTFREHIVREALNRAGGSYERIIAVGDGRWDLRAACAIGAEFIGVGPSTAPFGDWFPRTHLASSFDGVDLRRDYSLTPPTGAIGRIPDADAAFAAHPKNCVCWH